MSQKTSISKPQKIKIDGLEYEVRTITQWNDKGRTGTVDDSLPITNKVQYKPGATLSDPFPQFRDLADRTGDPKTNNGWSFRPVAGPAFKKALIEGGPNSLSTQLDTATQQQLAKDANVPIPRAQQVLNKTTTTKSNQALAADNQDPNAPAGGQNVAQADQSGDSSRPVSADTVSNTATQVSGTKTTGFGSLIYPENLGSLKQDVIKFTMMEYKPSGLGKGKGVSGGSDILQIGGGRGSDKEWSKGRSISGTVVLPIPNGISDTNSVDWGEDSMNALQAAAAAAAMTGITEGLGSMFNALGDTFSQTMQQDGENVKKLTTSAFAAAAVGGDTAKLLSRAEGVVVNPNMELLFNGPQLRPFNFTFKMSARNNREAQSIIKIINFFKRGMSPIKTESNLFLKSPNTFKIQYLHLGQNGKDHPYIGRIKECGLQNVTVNYTPDGQYATYQDGVMVSYEMTLQFKELEPIFNSDYDGLEGIGY